MEGYQLKLDLGEGAECHEAYEEYLEWSKLEDTNEAWVVFSKAYEYYYIAKTIAEKEQGTLQ